MKILCSFPGKVGDIIWSLPTVRAISRHFGVPVDFATTAQYGSEGLLRLIGEQEYIAKAYILPGWVVEDKECMQPREPEVGGYDMIIHLGYWGWPSCELAKYTHDTAWKQVRALDPELDMSPWIRIAGAPATTLPCVFVGWNQEWIELKMGVLAMLTKSVPEPLYYLCYAPGMRHEEFPSMICDVFEMPGDMYRAAQLLAVSDFYLGDLSAQWVLACAMGKPCVVMEPSEARWNPIFWWDGEGRNKMVLGGDGRPTFDARHVRDAVLAQLKEIK